MEEEGNDVLIWLYPLVEGEPVYHHPGPFDGIELSYCILSNPPEVAKLFLRVVSEFARHLPVVIYTLRKQDLGNPPDVSIIRNDIEEVIANLQSKGVKLG